MSHSARAAPALAQLRDSDPALAVLALWCSHRDDPGPTRSGADTIRYGPDFAGHDLPRQTGLAAHHVLHIALRHATRAAALAERLGPRFDATLYALAADAIVNEALQLAGQALPRPVVALTDLLARAGLGAQSPRAALADWDADRLAMALHRDGRAAQAARDYGIERGFAPDLEPDTGTTDGAETAETEAERRTQLTRALEAGRQAGTGIGLLGTALADLAPPRIPWEVRLRGLLARALSDAPRDSWRRPSGRWLAMEAQARAAGTPVPVYQPGRARDGLRPRLAVAVDTSSSVDDLTLALFGAEVAAIAARTGAEVHLLGFDDTVHTERRLPDGARDPLAGLSLRRGGGTAFAPVLARADRLAPALIVVLSDLDAPAPPRPRAPVLWVAPEDAPAAPPFGSRIDIPR